MPDLELILIADNRRITHWQLEALNNVGRRVSLTVLNCMNTRIRRKVGRHLLYYALRAVSFRGRWATKVPIDQCGLHIAETIDFESEYEGAWQRFPGWVQEWIRRKKPDAIIKFGMSLLRVPPDLGAPILSFHHGDPDRYRGRPAGFYELLDGQPRMGQIVQIISNKLDAGEVVAYAETKTFAHSYRATLRHAYGHSPILLRQAISNIARGRRIPKPCNGRNFRLPSNWTVVRFCLRTGSAFMRRILYGIFVEKAWNVSISQAPPEDVLGGTELSDLPSKEILRLRSYTFYADPFWHRDPPGLIVEAMNRRSGLGELLFIPDTGTQKPISNVARHFSYPAAVAEADRTYVIPEVSHWSEPRIYEFRAGRLDQVGMLDVESGTKIADPTLHWHDGRVYLFGNKASDGNDALYLWYSDSVFGRFVEHVGNPILVSPFGGRMAGQLVACDTGLYRLGQNALWGYGDGVLVFRIIRLGPTDYVEQFVREIRLNSVHGPHTLNWMGDRLVFDWYTNKVAPLAWLRRLRPRLFAGRMRVNKVGHGVSGDVGTPG